MNATKTRFGAPELEALVASPSKDEVYDQRFCSVTRQLGRSTTQERGWVRRRLEDPLLEGLRQGLSPDRVALALAAGVVIGVFPAPGLTTGICLLFGIAFGLNQAALQVANYAVYPLQLVLLIPFYRVAAAQFGYEVPFESAAQVIELVTDKPLGAVRILWGVTWRAAILWSMAAVPAAVALFVPLRIAVRALVAGRKGIGDR